MFGFSIKLTVSLFLNAFEYFFVSSMHAMTVVMSRDIMPRPADTMPGHKGMSEKSV